MKTTLTSTIFLFMLLLLSGNIQATDTLQTEKKISINDISCNGIISGDGFGLHYIPSMGIRFGKRTVISAGPLFRSESWKNDGFVIGSRFLLIRENESYSGHLILSANLSFEHFNNIHLSAATVENEKFAFNPKQSDQIPNFNEISYSGWEFTSGFEVSFRFRCGLLFRTQAGFAYDNSYQKTYPGIIMLRENKSISLSLSAGIGWKFGKMMNQKEHELKMMEEYQQELLVEQL